MIPFPPGTFQKVTFIKSYNLYKTFEAPHGGAKTKTQVNILFLSEVAKGKVISAMSNVHGHWHFLI